MTRLRLAKFLIFFPNYPPPDHNLGQILNSDPARSYFPLEILNKLRNSTRASDCEGENYILLYTALIVMAISSIAITSFISFVVWIAKRRKKILQTPQRVWIRPLDLLMGNQVNLFYFITFISLGGDLGHRIAMTPLRHPAP